MLLATLLLSGFATAQLRDRTEHNPPPPDKIQVAKKKNKNGPRAIGVLEFLPGGGARLVPVALWIDGHFYDASLYAANPAPMAVEPETLYEAFNYGEPTGWFTVTTAREVNGNWIAEGQWKPILPMDAKIAAQKATNQPKKKAPSLTSDDEGPPVLRRPGSSDSSAGGNQSTAPGAGSNPASTGDASSSSGSGSPQSQSQSQSKDDPDRPTLKVSPSAGSASSSSRPSLGDDGTQPASAPAAASAPPASPANNDDDPNRPVLRRGKPPAQLSVSTPTPAAPVTGGKASQPAAALAAAGPKAPQALRGYPAISDAGDHEPRSMLYALAPAEREDKTGPMLALALEQVRSFASKSNAPPIPPGTAITDYDLRAYDLDFSNSPTLVLTAKLRVAPTKPKAAGAKSRAAGSKPPIAKAQPTSGADVDYFVTVVARLDLNGQPIKIYSAVTDSNHLDAYPRVEIVDAVDADANGRGDLLFRQYSDTSVSYALYRIYPYQMEKIFQGGAGM